MKTLLLSLSCAAGLAAATAAHAQVFQPQTARNILIGGVAGAIIGDHNDHALEGAAIGAAAGYVWSALTTPAQPVYTPHGRVVCGPAPAVAVCVPPVVVARPVVVTRPVVVAPCPPRVVYRYPARREVVYVPARPYPHAHRVVVYRNPYDRR